jgi:VCBS repeat-containing protein
MALMLAAAMALSGVAQAGASTSTAASPTQITYVCVNKSTGQLFYLASCAKSQTSTSVTSSSTPFKACYLTSNGVTRRVSDTTTCGNTPRKMENTISQVPADSDSLYFCVKSSDGTMYYKPGTTAPTCPTGQYAVVIAHPNQAPVAVGDTYSTDADTTLNVSAASGVLANDTDPDNDPITAVKVSDPAHGTLTLNPDGSFSYTPVANYNGTDSFTYKASDGKADSNVATVTITVNSPDAQCQALAIQTLGSSFNPDNYTFHAGTLGDDDFTGKATAGTANVFCGFGGNDSIGTLDTGDFFFGGDGNDQVNNNFGTFYGGDGNDTVIGFNFGTTSSVENGV